jgi:lycopene cyclase domain-containing protein
MSTTIPTYLEFLALLVVPFAGALFARALGRSMPLRRWAGVGLMIAVALVYTTPWDNALVAAGVWWYGEGAVLGTLWHAPIGEYAFIVLQTVFAALWLYAVLDWAGVTVPYRFRDVSRRARLLGVLAGLVVGGAGVAMLFRTPTTYLGAILAWAGPVLALQWGFAPGYLLRRWRVVAIGVGVPTVYFWIIDRMALELGLWIISPRYTTGVVPLGLPIEEAVFFLVTSLFIVQGLVLLEWVLVGQPDVAREWLDTTLEAVGIDSTALRAMVDRWA